MKNLIVPGDKSISHRAILFGSLSEGVTHIKGLLEGEDVLHTIKIFQELGVSIEKKKDIWIVSGKGLGGLRPPRQVLDCGNSGTTMRLLLGLLSACPFVSTLTGDDSLNRRPMRRVIDPLIKMGAKIREYHEGASRFIEVQGGPLHPAQFKIPVASAQVKSALILAGLASGVKVSVKEPQKSRDHTEKMLKAFGADIHVKGLTVEIRPGGTLRGLSLQVPSDFSSAVFFLVAALISPDSRKKVCIKNVGINETRTGALDILRRMGAKIQVLHRKKVGGEPVADLVARSSKLKAIKIGGSIIPRLIDEIPILCVAAARARGKTVIRDAAELRVKESDRIRAMATEFSRFGVQVRELEDGLEITGSEADLLYGASCQSYGDHRVAMSLMILGTAVSGETVIDDTRCVETSFPNFGGLLNKFTK